MVCKRNFLLNNINEEEEEIKVDLTLINDDVSVSIA